MRVKADVGAVVLTTFSFGRHMKTCTLTMIALTPLLSSLGACAEREEPSIEGVTLSVERRGVPDSVELIQPGFFLSGSTRAPHEVARVVHVGFGDIRSGQWSSVSDVEVVYDASGRNEAVKIPVPKSESTRKFLFYSLGFDAYLGDPGDGLKPSRVWISNQAVRLDAPDGKFVAFPLWGSAPSPYAPECYNFSTLREANDGRVRGVIFGFTSWTRAELDRDENAPWFNVEDAPRFEGFLEARYARDGRDELRPLYARVPRGRNLVFKAVLDRYAGRCQEDGDTQPIPPPPGQDGHLTRNQLLEVNP